MVAASGKIWTQMQGNQSNRRKTKESLGNLKDISTPATGEELVMQSLQASMATKPKENGTWGYQSLSRIHKPPFDFAGGI